MYTIKDLAIITRLSDRTLRNYLNLGVLNGEKKNGTWIFTPQQIQKFLENKMVKAATDAKRNALVFDFMANTWKKENAACMILDLQQDHSTSVMNFICEAVNKTI